MRLIIRLVVVGIVLAIAWVGYQLADITKCDGPKANAWAEAYFQRVDESTADMESISEYTSDYQFSILAARAQARYRFQEAELAPACLKTLQSKTTLFFWNEWQGYQSASIGDYASAANYFDNIDATLADIKNEIYRLAGKYDWDLSK
jgi:hypothetical protein